MWCKRAAAAAVIVLVACSPALLLAQSSGSASLISRFVGTWKEDVSKRKVGAQANLRFQRDANGGLQELRGPDVRPDVQSIVFDGQPHQIGTGRNRIAWKQIDPNTFERVLSDGAQTLTVRRIRISADGKTLTEATERKVADGRTLVNTVVFQRSSGESQGGLVGRWKPQSFDTNNPPVVKYEAVGATGLKFSEANNTPTDTTYTVMLDDKPVAVVGAAVIRGTMTAARQVDDHTIEFTQSRDGVVSGKNVRTVSADGKTLTVTTTTVGPNAGGEPSVSVFVRQ
jgi:hypothetical protein